jgi:cytochrome c553
MNYKPLGKAVALAMGVFLGGGQASAMEQTPAEESAVHDPAMQIAPNLDNGRKLYETCAICHGPQGWGTPDGRYPQIAGQNHQTIIKQMKDIRNGNRDNPTMYPFTLPSIIPDDQALADVAGYIEQLPMAPFNEVGSGRDIEHGETLYRFNCATCHGKNGEGTPEKTQPEVHGQHYQYLLRQLHWLKMGKRRNGDPTMLKQIANLNGRDLDALADYMSRMRPPADKLAAQPAWQNPDFPPDFRSVMNPPPMPPMPPMPSFQPPMPGFQAAPPPAEATDNPK